MITNGFERSTIKTTTQHYEKKKRRRESRLRRRRRKRKEEGGGGRRGARVKYRDLIISHPSLRRSER